MREALVAMLASQERFEVVAEVATAHAAIDAARRLRPDLALVEPELSGCAGWWAILQIQSEQLANVVVAFGRRADCGQAQLVGAETYVQMGTPPRDLLHALDAVLAGRAETEQNLLTDAHPVLDKPALVSL